MAVIAGLPSRPRRIGVFRALVLGDMLCATPALRALSAQWPQAELVMIGLPWAREWAERVPDVHRFIEFPGFPGLPEREPDLAALPGFLQNMQQERFDLLVQLHGSGQIVNSLLAACAPLHLAGFVTPGVYCAEPALHADWPREGHEIERLLRLVDHLGLARQGSHMTLTVTPADRGNARELLGSCEHYVCVHAGARFPSRRWPAERFAAVADRLADEGHRVVLTGTANERPISAAVAAAMRQPCLDLSGQTDLWTMAALVEAARLVVCNDTGMSHVAAALGTPSIVISAGSDASRWGPLDTSRHQVLAQAMACRPCEHVDCPFEHACATAITVPMVAAAASRALSAWPGHQPESE